MSQDSKQKLPYPWEPYSKQKLPYPWEPYIKNTFFPNCSADMLSLNKIFLFLRHTSYTMDDLPADVRSDYEKALPYLKELFRRD